MRKCMKLITVLTLGFLFATSSCSMLNKSCCAKKETTSCSKEECKKPSCEKEEKCKDGSCKKEEKKPCCADDHCKKKS